MTQPAPEDIEVAVAALRSDATQWEAMAVVARAAAASANGLNAGTIEFSSMAGWVGLPEQYTELQDKMARLLSEAGYAFDGIATALRTAASSYEAEEAAGVHRLKDIY